MADDFASFEEFWPFYLSEHSDVTCRRLHFVGTTLAIGIVGASVVTLNPFLLPLAPIAGYGCAWIGHFGFEKNQPATFRYPAWSFRADFKMYGLMLQGKLWSGSPLDELGPQSSM